MLGRFLEGKKEQNMSATELTQNASKDWGLSEWKGNLKTPTEFEFS